MAIHSLSAPDNDSHMCGSADRLLPDVHGVPACPSCGYRTSLSFVNPAFVVKRRTLDLSATYDNYFIASRKFAQACRRLELDGFEFLPLPQDADFLVVHPVSLTPFDSEARQTRFEGLCGTCGFHAAVAGAVPAFLKSPPRTPLSATDVVFGSGNCRGRILLATEHAKAALSREKLKGLEFMPAKVTGTA